MPDQLFIQNVAIVAVITGVIEAVKKALNYEIVHQLAPLMALVLGVVFALGLQGFSFENVIVGITYGLIAMGLYSGTKSTVKTVRSVVK